MCAASSSSYPCLCVDPKFPFNFTGVIIAIIKVIVLIFLIRWCMRRRAARQQQMYGTAMPPYPQGSQQQYPQQQYPAYNANGAAGDYNRNSEEAPPAYAPKADYAAVSTFFKLG